jgi:hypothetical protein
MVFHVFCCVCLSCLSCFSCVPPLSFTLCSLCLSLFIMCFLFIMFIMFIPFGFYVLFMCCFLFLEGAFWLCFVLTFLSAQHTCAWPKCVCVCFPGCPLQNWPVNLTGTLTAYLVQACLVFFLSPSPNHSCGRHPRGDLIIWWIWNFDMVSPSL